ncbi:MAG: hypothetical protein KC620_14080, partial [Myxococcales bacterium]|nr:hypothetical protein [Myxococcales bacterium]
MLPGRIRSALFGALALVGCDGGAVQVAPGDAFVVDAQPGADGAMPDARPAPDAAVYDARPLTDAEPDAMPDAAPDATPDAAPDAAPADERGDWQARAVYLLMVDRFANGAPDPGPEDTCFDPANPRKFHGGDLVGLRERLDYFEALGVDAIWVTPLTEQVPQHGEECGYHGYWAALRAPDDGAIEPRLGTADDLDDLLDAMHARGQRLILDMVVNHAGYDAPIVETHPEWFHPRAGCEQLGDPDETCPLANLPDFDQDRDDVARYLIDASLGWVTRHAIDGIRVDTVKHVPLSFFADDWLPALRAARPEIHVVGEVFDAGPYPTQVPYLDAGFDALFDFRLRQALVDGLARVGDLDPAAVRVQEAFNSLGPTRARLRNLFLENHDVPRFASEITTDDAGEAVDRYHLALAVLMTTPGTPQLYAGTELGMIGRWPENRRDHPAWAFDGP